MGASTREFLVIHSIRVPSSDRGVVDSGLDSGMCASAESTSQVPKSGSAPRGADVLDAVFASPVTKQPIPFVDLQGCGNLTAASTVEFIQVSLRPSQQRQPTTVRQQVPFYGEAHLTTLVALLSNFTLERFCRPLFISSLATVAPQPPPSGTNILSFREVEPRHFYAPTTAASSSRSA